jgi:hypothetical protein
MKRLSLLLCLMTFGACSGDIGGSSLTSVVITGDSTVSLNGTLQLTATAFAGNVPLATGLSFVWISSDSTKVSVSQTGLVSGVQLGSADITVIAVPAVTNAVTSAPYPIRSRIGRIVIRPFDIAFAALGDSVIVTAEARDALDVAVPGIVFTWQSRNAKFVTVADSGTHSAIARAVGSGSTVVVATADAVSDSVTATVP